MYGIFTYIWLIFIVNVGKHTLHGAYGNYGTGISEYVIVYSGSPFPKRTI